MTGEPTGANTIVNYYWEDNGFRNDPTDSTPKVWGANAQLTTNEATNNGTRITLPASRTSVKIKEGTFDGAWAVQFGLTNPWWLRTIRGEPSTTDNGDGTYTHTYDGDLEPIRIVEGYETTGTERILQGCVPATATIGPSVGENTAACTIEGFYSYEETSNPADLTAQASLDFDVLNYADARLDLNSSEQLIMQEATLSFALNTDPIPGFGSRFPISYIQGLLEPDIDYTKIKQDDAPLENVYGGSTSMQEDVADDDSLTLDLDNGETGTDANQQTFKGTGSFPESYGEDGVGDIQSTIDENINRLLRDMTIEATNGVQTPP